MIVHPGFGDLQKWILQVKYNLVAKEWVSDSKILKRRPKDLLWGVTSFSSALIKYKYTRV